ncbi:hypothetical protein JTB14_032231 [Gonioctena quinquepunctata]|nr:hypothetical protein JTB14_032231 [Gonioctena quinquepunctata]
MDKNELEQLATFMGHTEKTHAQFYRLADDIYQTAKVSKLLMMAKTNSIEQYKGKALSEIEIGENLVEDADEDESDEEGGILENSEMENELNIGCSMIRENNKEHKNAEQDIDSQKKKKTKRTLIPWTEQQKSHVEEFFRKHIMKKKAPRNMKYFYSSKNTLVFLRTSHGMSLKYMSRTNTKRKCEIFVQFSLLDFYYILSNCTSKK